VGHPLTRSSISSIDVAWQYAIGARGSEDPALRKMEKHFAQLAEEHFNSGLLAYGRITDLIRGATCLGMYNYWTAQYHKVSFVGEGL
jgi:hypothetical protein